MIFEYSYGIRDKFLNEKKHDDYLNCKR